MRNANTGKVEEQVAVIGCNAPTHENLNKSNTINTMYMHKYK